MSALRFLELIDSSNQPTESLKVLADPSRRKEALATLLRERYATAIALADPARTTPGHLHAAFRSTFKIDAETLRKAVAFFVHAWQDAGLEISPSISGKSRPGAGPMSAPPLVHCSR